MSLFGGFCSRDNPLFFRKDGSLDFGPGLLLAWSVVGLVVYVTDAILPSVTVSVAAYSYLAGVTGLAYIAGAHAERAYWIAQSKLPGEFAAGVAEAASEYTVEPLTRAIDDPDASA